MKSMWLVILAAAAAWGQSVSTGGSTSIGGAWGGAGTVCGPPLYPCSTTSLTTYQLPGTIPSMGNLTGAGTVITDTSIGSNSNRIARITDNNLDSGISGSTYIIDPGGSGDGNLWNTNSTILYVSSTGSRGYFMNFNPATMQAGLRYASTNHLSGNGSFSYSSPTLFFQIGLTTSTSLDRIDISNPNTFPSVSGGTITTLFDFATSSTHCLGAGGGYTATWNANIAISKNPADTIVGAGFSNAGGQGTGVDIVGWKSGSGCSYLNLSAGLVAGDWGTTGAVGISDRFKIHDIQMTKDGRYIRIAMQPNTCLSSCASNTYYWQIGTTNLAVGCPSGTQCGGHDTEGFTHDFNNVNSPLWQWVSRPFSSPSMLTTLLTSFPPGTLTPTDTHAGYPNADANDTFMFFEVQGDVGKFCCAGNYPAAWTNEILGIDPTGILGTLKRFAHTYNTGESLIFDTSQTIASVSQDGRFLAYSGDWMGSLGQSDGATASCRGGGADWTASHAYSRTSTAACSGTVVSNNNCILPYSGNAGEYIFAATAGGTSGALGSEPIWPQTVGSTVTDNGVTWTNAGQPNCRGDVFVVELR